jgi:hypothetical protein
MMYLFAFLLGTGIFCGAYKFGKYANEGSVITLEGQNTFLHDQVNFLRAENDHLRKVLDRRIETAHEMTDLRDGPPYAMAIGLCFHGVSLSEHCGHCARQNFVAGGILN